MNEAEEGIVRKAKEEVFNIVMNLLSKQIDIEEIFDVLRYDKYFLTDIKNSLFDEAKNIAISLARDAHELGLTVEKIEEATGIEKSLFIGYFDKVRIKEFHQLKDWILIMKFDNDEFRVINMKKFLAGTEGLMAEIREDALVFDSAELDPITGTIEWINGVDFEPANLYHNSVGIVELFGEWERKRHE